MVETKWGTCVPSQSAERCVFGSGRIMDETDNMVDEADGITGEEDSTVDATGKADETESGFFADDEQTQQDVLSFAVAPDEEPGCSADADMVDDSDSRTYWHGIDTSALVRPEDAEIPVTTDPDGNPANMYYSRDDDDEGGIVLPVDRNLVPPDIGTTPSPTEVEKKRREKLAIRSSNEGERLLDGISGVVKKLEDAGAPTAVLSASRDDIARAAKKRVTFKGVPAEGVPAEGGPIEREPGSAAAGIEELGKNLAKLDLGAAVMTDLGAIVLDLEFTVFALHSDYVIARNSTTDTLHLIRIVDGADRPQLGASFVLPGSHDYDINRLPVMCAEPDQFAAIDHLGRFQMYCTHTGKLLMERVISHKLGDPSTPVVQTAALAVNSDYVVIFEPALDEEHEGTFVHVIPWQCPHIAGHSFRSGTSTVFAAQWVNPRSLVVSSASGLMFLDLQMPPWARILFPWMEMYRLFFPEDREENAEMYSEMFRAYITMERHFETTDCTPVPEYGDRYVPDFAAFTGLLRKYVWARFQPDFLCFQMHFDQTTRRLMMCFPDRVYWYNGESSLYGIPYNRPVAAVPFGDSMVVVDGNEQLSYFEPPQKDESPASVPMFLRRGEGKKTEFEKELQKRAGDDVEVSRVTRDVCPGVVLVCRGNCVLVHTHGSEVYRATVASRKQ